MTRLAPGPSRKTEGRSRIKASASAVGRGVSSAVLRPCTWRTRKTWSSTLCSRSLVLLTWSTPRGCSSTMGERPSFKASPELSQTAAPRPPASPLASAIVRAGHSGDGVIRAVSKLAVVCCRVEAHIEIGSGKVAVAAYLDDLCLAAVRAIANLQLAGCWGRCSRDLGGSTITAPSVLRLLTTVVVPGAWVPLKAPD